MARTILVAVKDLLFGSKIQEAGKRTGTTLAWASRFERLSEVAKAKRPDVIIADLSQPEALDELTIILRDAPQVRVIGFAGHVLEDLMDGARKIGVAEVLTKGQFSSQVDRILVRERGEAEASP
jgi:DNA-binding NarL/FixJ family response regulator